MRPYGGVGGTTKFRGAPSLAAPGRCPRPPLRVTTRVLGGADGQGAYRQPQQQQQHAPAPGGPARGMPGGTFLMPPLAPGLAEVLGRLQAGARRWQRGQTSLLERLRMRGRAAAELRAEVAALTQQNAQLLASEQELRRRTAALEAKLDAQKAMMAVNGALQVFRRHAAGRPLDLDLDFFDADAATLVAVGGTAKVYAWQWAGHDWAVKDDVIRMSYASSGRFSPERCGDLLPTMLPPHPNLQAPVAWKVGAPVAAPAGPEPPAAALPTGPSPPPPTPLAPLPTTTAATATAIASTPSTTSPLPITVKPSRVFHLLTAYDFLPCNLEHMRAQRKQLELEQGQAAGGCVWDGRSSVLGERELLTTVHDVAAALEHLGAHGVAHCDVKPANVMLRLGGGGGVAQAVLCDFGLARLMGRGVDRVEARGGSWLFQAPEQLAAPADHPMLGAARAHVTRGTDTWALGALICYIVHGGSLPHEEGLPSQGLGPHEVLKAGMRPSKQGGMEPFHMLRARVLGGGSSSSSGGGGGGGGSSTPYISAPTMRLLRQLAGGCMHADPTHRLHPSEVKKAQPPMYSNEWTLAVRCTPVQKTCRHVPLAVDCTFKFCLSLCLFPLTSVDNADL